MEIKSRMSSTNKLRDTVSKLKQEVRGEIKDIRSASTERVARIEQKTAVLLSAERKLYARQAELETTFAEHMRKLDDALLSLKEEVEELSVNQVLAESLVQEDVTVRLREGWDTLGEALGKELREDSAAMREQIETSITQAIALVDQDTARFHEEIQRQLAGLAKQRSDDLKLIQEVAEEAMRRCDEEEQTAASIQQELDELLEGVVGWAEKQRNLQEDVEALQGHLAGGSSSRLSAVEGKIDALDDALQELQVSTASNETVSEVARAMDEQFDMQEVGMHSLQQNIHKLREDFESSVNKLSMEVEAARREAPEIHARQAKAGAHVVSDDELPLPTLTSLEGQLIDMEVDAVLASELTAIEHGAVLDAVLSLTSAFRESERRVSGLTVLAQGLEEHQRAALVQLEASQTEKAERSAEELDKVNARVRELAANVDRQMEDMDGAREQLERRVLAASSEALLAREAADELKSRLEGLEVDIRLSEELVAAELEDATRGRNQQEGQDLVERLATVRADIEAERERRRHLESQQEAHRTQLETAQEIHAVSLRSEIADLGKHIDGLRNDLAQLRVTQHETSHAQPEAREAGAATALSETAALATQVQGLADDVATLFKRHELLLDAGVLVESRVDGVEQELKQAAEIGSTNSERMDELQVEMTLSEESLRAELAGMVEQLSQEAENVRIGEQEVRNQVDALRSQLEASHEALELRLEAAHQAGARPEELKRVEDGIAKLAADVMQLKGSAMEPARTTDEFASALRRLEEHLAAVDADMVLADEVSKVEEEWVLDRIQSTSEAVSAALENYSDMLKWKEGIDSLVEEARPQFEGIRESVSHLANPPLASTPAEPQADQHWRQEAEDKSQLLAAALASAGQDIEGLQRRQSVLEQQLGSLVKRVEEAAVAAQANAAAPRGETGANQSGTVVPQEVMSATSENLHDGLNNTLSAMSNMGDHLAALKETVSALESKVDQGGHDIVERLLQVCHIAHILLSDGFGMRRALRHLTGSDRHGRLRLKCQRRFCKWMKSCRG